MVRVGKSRGNGRTKNGTVRREKEGCSGTERKESEGPEPGRHRSEGQKKSETRPNPAKGLKETGDHVPPACLRGTYQTGYQRCRLMPMKSATGDPKSSRLKPKGLEEPANAPVGLEATAFDR